MSTPKRRRRQLRNPSRSSSTRWTIATVQVELTRSSQEVSGSIQKQSGESSCPTENGHRRTDAARAVPESEAKAESQCRKFRRRSRFHSHSLHKKRCDPKSDARRRKRPSESKELSVMLLSGLSTKQPAIREATEMQAEAERRRSERDQQGEINLAREKQPDRDSVERQSAAQDPGAQAQSKQKRTRDQQACLRRYQQGP